MTWTNRGTDTEREAVVRAAVGQNDALQRLDYADFRANTCAQQAGVEAEVLARQRNSVAAKGARYVDNVTGVSIDGDRATANVSYYFAVDKDDKVDTVTDFVREDGAWRVCSPGPANASFRRRNRQRRRGSAARLHPARVFPVNICTHPVKTLHAWNNFVRAGS